MSASIRNDMHTAILVGFGLLLYLGQFPRKLPHGCIIKCYKNASRLNRYNFPTVNAIDLLFSTLHTTVTGWYRCIVLRMRMALGNRVGCIETVVVRVLWWSCHYILRIE